MIHKIVEGVLVPRNIRADLPNTSFPADLSSTVLPDGYVWVEPTPAPSVGLFMQIEPSAPIRGEDGVWRQAWAIRPWTAEETALWRESVQCGPLQLRRALRQTGDYAAVVAALEQADEETQEAWEYASDIRRMDPTIEAMRRALGKTDEDVDQLFLLAQTF